MDMLVNLQTLPAPVCPDQIRIIRALPPDRREILSFVEREFGTRWASEGETALSFQPPKCFLALRENRLIGFACYDATAKGFFGPIGLIKGERRGGAGKALLLSCLAAMREDGYGYAVIGWCDEAMQFYIKAAGAVPIPGSEPQNSVYQRLLPSQKS